MPPWNKATAEETIRALTSRLWQAEITERGLRSLLQESERLVNTLTNEVCDLYNLYGVDPRARHRIEEES